MKNMLVAQSGGPSAAINATITGVIDAGLASSRVEHVYGALNGIKGVLNENFVILDDICKKTETRDLLAMTPAAALGSCRKGSWSLLGLTVKTGIPRPEFSHPDGRPSASRCFHQRVTPAFLLLTAP